MHARGKMGRWFGPCAQHGRDAGAVAAAHVRAAAELGGQLLMKRTQMGQLGAGALSSSSCPSNVTAAFCRRRADTKLSAGDLSRHHGGAGVAAPAQRGKQM
jgi:hypothetical protein